MLAIFSNIILQKRALGAGQLFPSSSYVWNDRPSFHKKIDRVKGRFSQQNSTFDFSTLFISFKSEIKDDHSKRSKADNLNWYWKR